MKGRKMAIQCSPHFESHPKSQIRPKIFKNTSDPPTQKTTKHAESSTIATDLPNCQKSGIFKKSSSKITLDPPPHFGHPPPQSREVLGPKRLRTGPQRAKRKVPLSVSASEWNFAHTFYPLLHFYPLLALLIRAKVEKPNRLKLAPHRAKLKVAP